MKKPSPGTQPVNRKPAETIIKAFCYFVIFLYKYNIIIFINIYYIQKAASNWYTKFCALPKLKLFVPSSHQRRENLLCKFVHTSLVNPYAAWWLILLIQQKALKMTETLSHGTHLRVLRKSFQMSTNMTGFRWFSKIFASLCIGRK